MIRFKVFGKQRRKCLLFTLMLILITLHIIVNNIRALFCNGNEQYWINHEQNQNNIKDLGLRKSPIILLYWSKVFRQSVEINNTEVFPFFSVNEDCEQKCEITVDKSRATKADAIIIHARDPNPFPPEKFFHIPFILHTNENPVYSEMLSNPLFLSYFKYSMSYRLDSDFPSLSYTKPLSQAPVPFEQKKFVFAAFSNCEIVRTVYLAKLMQFIPIDSYGACLKNKNGLPNRYQDFFKEAKMEMSRYYKFTLVFMNADCEYFVDDQLTHALSAGSVPIFMGTDKVDEFLPGNLKSAVIKVRDFKAPKDLAKYLLFLNTNEREYNKYLKWKNEGFHFPPNYSSSLIGRMWSSRDTVYCKICKRLANNKNERTFGLKPDLCKPRDWNDWLDGSRPVPVQDN